MSLKGTSLPADWRDKSNIILLKISSRAYLDYNMEAAFVAKVLSIIYAFDFVVAKLYIVGALPHFT